jgi:Cdc6-like AAA superfamily ATPase
MSRPNPFSEGKSVFRNSKTFDQGWTPDWKQDKLPCRGAEVDSLVAVYRPVITEHGNMNINTLILGKGGIGKTILARYFGKLFRDAAIESGMEFLGEYIDCNEHCTRNAILREALSKLKISTGRGYSDPELMKQMVTHLKKNDGYLFLILDEAHKLPHDDLLSFLNASITFGSTNVRMSFLCVSRAEEWLRYSDERLTSRIQKTYTLKPYDFHDALEILHFRNKLAFNSGTFPDPTLELTAKVVEKEKNMRQGIEILRTVAIHLDEHRLSEATLEMIRTAAGEAISSYDTDILNYITNEHEYAILLGIARYFKNGQKMYITTPEIEDQYKIICEEYHLAYLKFASLKRYIKKIEGFGILSKSFALPEGKERGRESRFGLNDMSAEKLDELITRKLNTTYK